MNWIKSSQFQFVQNPDRHYVFRRNNTGNTEIDVPKNITTKGRARMWLLAHPEAPTRFRRTILLLTNLVCSNQATTQGCLFCQI